MTCPFRRHAPIAGAAALVALVALLALTACKARGPAPAPAPGAASTPTAAAPPVAPHAAGPHLEHGTPAERMARYEDPQRAAWQRPDEVVRALALAPDARVVDLGVGSGYFAVRLARIVARGQVVGLDIEPAFVAAVNERARTEGLPNLSARQCEPDDPGLAPASVDLILIVDTYHHLPDRPAYLARLRLALRPAGRIAIVDFKKDAKYGPPPEHKLTREEVLAEAARAGLGLVREHDFLPEQYFLELGRR